MKYKIINSEFSESNIPIMFNIRTFFKMEKIMKKIIKIAILFIFSLPLSLSIALSQTKEVNEVIKETSQVKNSII